MSQPLYQTNESGRERRDPVLGGGSFAVFDFDGGNACIDGPGFEVTGGDGAEAKHSTFSEVYTRRDRRAGADPRVGVETHRVGEQREGGRVIVVGGAAEVGILREDDMGTEADGCGIVNLRAIGDADRVGADEIPGSPDPGGWIEMAVGTELRAEAAQQERTPAVKWTRRRAIEERAGEVPEEAAGAVSG